MIHQYLVHIRTVPVNNIMLLKELFDVVDLFGELSLHIGAVVLSTSVGTVVVLRDFLTFRVPPLHI